MGAEGRSARAALWLGALALVLALNLDWLRFLARERTLEPGPYETDTAVGVVQELQGNRSKHEGEPALAGERAWIKCVGQPASGGGGDDGPVEGKGGNDPSNVKEKPKETYRADAEAVFVKYVEKLRRREAQAREAMEDGEAMDEGVYDAQDDEDVAVELRRRKERDDLSDELDARGGKRDRRR